MEGGAGRSIVAAVLIGTMLTCCLGSCVLTGFWAARDQAGWAPIEEACNGTPASSATAYARTPGVHRATAFERQTTGWLHHGYGWIPNEWNADDPPEAELVACWENDESEELVEHCEYLLDGTGVRVGAGTVRAIDRYRRARTVSIREARTGAELSHARVMGPLPALCPDEYAFGGSTRDRIDGAGPGAEELRPLLEPFANVR